MSIQGYWADHKAPDFRDLPDDMIAVLPVGATEQHGPHLPVSVDSDLVAAVVERTFAAAACRAERAGPAGFDRHQKRRT